ncbi:porin [Enterovibrio nigricans]|uniref:Outer membrane protein (Porin) n=1 Tax=Enterovibrio nigricans DSM 22720 TaxID=1121868 RepID=A0A1T4U6Q9_9GAMM|nr:porin [Enterovibrio nigricans]PKF51711.1 porin [Enterovibrio nigricans]SKA48326.1 Outer membrane protein (porin) [Enterovibrio nigricans DSM 22720]
MEKMFKRSVLGAAVALAAVAGSANAAIELAGENVVLYGQAAGAIIATDPQGEGKDGVIATDIESRFGFRGRVEFDNFAPDFVWQMEAGNANSDGGSLGQRDTYLGFDFDGVGSFKYGRQLVAAYNYVDWPHTNPGLGDVFDNTWGAGNDTGASFEGRANNVLRFDSASFSGFNFQATLSGMGSTTDALVTSVAGSYSQSLFSVHAGYYSQDKYKADGVDAGDASYYIVGGSVFLGDLTVTAGYKKQDNGLTNVDQATYSFTAAYNVADNVFVKAGYAKAAETTGQDNDDVAMTARVGYLLPSAVLYFDVRDYDVDGATKTDDVTKFIFGTEYYF